MRKNLTIILDKGEKLSFNVYAKRYVVTDKCNLVVSCGGFNASEYIEVKYNEEIKDEKR